MIIIALALLSPAVVGPRAQAVSPAPDGGYPGGNTAEGQNALLSLTTGHHNSAVGYLSLRTDATGSYNTAIGAGALFANTADENTATGFGALLANSMGARNTADGALALFNNTTGLNNTAIGDSTLFNNTTGIDNTAVGWDVLFANTTGVGNTAMGINALLNNNGDFNTAEGYYALSLNTTGSNNTALGYNAGSNLTTGTNNIDIGYNVQGVGGEHDTIRIGNTDITTTIIRGISGQTIPSGATVLVASNGQLGTMTSSARFKEDIKPMDKTSEAVLALRPVSFRYKKEIDPERIAQFGLVAEDVEKVDPDLVVRDNEGKPYSVRYDQVNAMLLNEFIKEHRKVGEQEATIAELKSTVAQQQKRFAEQDNQLAGLAAGLQKVTAQIETSRAQPQLVNAP
jgi:uncharacterized coiled-coil protein SlyX